MNEYDEFIGSIWATERDIRILVDFKPMGVYQIVRAVFLLGTGHLHHSLFTIEDMQEFYRDFKDDFRRVDT